MRLIKVFVGDRGTEFLNPEKVVRAWLSPGGPNTNKWYWRFRFGNGEEAVSEGFPTEKDTKAWAATVGIEVIE